MIFRTVDSSNRNTRIRTCGSDERLMLPPDRGGVPVVQSTPPLRCDIITELAPSITWLISALINRQAVIPGSRLSETFRHTKRIKPPAPLSLRLHCYCNPK